MKLNNTEHINTEIVDDIMNSLISDKNIIQQYKRLCHNILVECSDTIVFYDYASKHNIFTTWINDVVYSICKNDKCHFDRDKKHCYSRDFKTNKPRLMIINELYMINNREYKTYTKKELNNIIREILDLGIKNVIVTSKNANKNYYDYKKFSDYMNVNEERILKTTKCEDSGYYNEDVFYKPSLLLNNFIKWCCC